MPLLNGTVFTANTALPAGLLPETEVWQLRATGETFTSYNELLTRQELLRSRDFASGYSGKSGLNFEEALFEDEHCLRSLQKFPMELEEAALRLVHNSYATVAELVDRVYAEYRPGKENAVAGEHAPPRQKHPMTRPLIRSWLWHVGNNMQLEGRTTFKAKQQYVTQYKLDMPPAELLEKAKLVGGLHVPGEASSGEAQAKENGHAQAARRSRPVASQKAPPNSIEEDEARLQKMPDKLVAFNILRAAGKQGMRVADVVAAIKALPEHAEWDNKRSVYLRNALKSDRAFTRVGMGTFALRSLAGNVDWAEAAPEAAATASEAAAPKKRKLDAQLQLVDVVSAAAGDDSSKPAKAARTSSGKAVCIDSAAFQDPAAKFAVMAQRMSQHGTDGEQADAICVQTITLLKLYQDAKQQAEEALTRAKERAEVQPKTKSPVKSAAPAGDAPSFALTEEEKQYKGEAEDRKALMAHLRWVTEREQQLQQQKDAWQAKQRSSRAGKASPATAVGKAVSKAGEVLEAVTACWMAAEKGAAEVLGNLQRLQKAQIVAEEKAERERVRREERERRLRELAEAKRYPIEDLEHLQEQLAKAASQGAAPPAEDIPLPEMMGAEESEALATTLYASDFISQFAEVLELQQGLSFLQLHELLKGGRGSRAEAGDGRSALWSVFRGLLSFILKDERHGERGGHLRQLLSTGTWPEVMLRYVLRSSESPLVSSRAAMAAGMLERECADGLAAGHLRALLAYLCDEALDAEAMREAMDSRLGEAHEAGVALRKAAAEENARIKKVELQEKEERKAKREAEAQKRAQEAAAAAEQAAAPASEPGEEAAVGEAASKEATPAEGPPQPAAPGNVKGAEAGALLGEEEEEVEPSWELPEELRDAQCPSDRKELLQFRQSQQAARKALERGKEKWLKGAAEREKAREAARRARALLEKARVQEKAAAEEALLQKRAAYERELSELAVRAKPLGQDRHYRRYWWGLGAQRGCLFVEDAEARLVGAWHTIAEIDSLMQALDGRGVREQGLLAELSKAKEAIALAMQPVSTPNTPTAEADDEAKRYSQRERAQVVMYSPGRTKHQMAAKAAVPAASKTRRHEEPEAAAVAGGLEGQAAHAAGSCLKLLHKLAGKADLLPPEGDSSWKACSDAVKTACDMLTHSDASGGAGSSQAEARKLLVQQLLALEAVLSTASDAQLSPQTAGGDGNNADDEAPAEEVHQENESSADSSDDDSGSKSSNGQVKLWHGEEERAAWLREASQAVTAARVAYCAAVLKLRAEPLLEHLAEQQHQLLAEQAEQVAARDKQAAAAAKKAAADAKKAAADAKKLAAAGAKQAAEAKKAAAKQAAEEAEGNAAAQKAAEAKQAAAAKGKKPAKKAEAAEGGQRAATTTKGRAAEPAVAKKAGAGKRKGKEAAVPVSKRTRSAH